MITAHIAGRAFGRPLLLEPTRGLAFLSGLQRALEARNFASGRMEGDESDYADDGARGPVYASLPVGLVERGRKVFSEIGPLAVIEMTGVLVNRLGSVNPFCGMTGYDGLRTQLFAAMQDTAVKGIAFYVDSPGGEVTGCFDLADQIRAAREQKPVWAIVDGQCASAAYALSCGAGRITCSSTGMVGSIGVICGHVDTSKALEIAGLKVTLIYAGPHKADGNEYSALPEEVRAEFQAEIDAVYSQFVALSAKGRGLAPAVIKNTESRSYLAAAAVELGLADDVLSPTDALAEFVELVS